MDVFRLLSTPHEGDYASLAAELAATQFHVFGRRALRIAALAGHPDDPVLADIVQRIAARPATVAYWTPEVGVTLTALNNPSPTEADYRWLQAQLALAAHVTGVTAHLDLEITVERCLLACGRTIAPGSWRMRGDARSLELARHGAPAGEPGSAPVRFHTLDGAGGPDREPVWVEAGAEARVVFASIASVASPWHPVRLVGGGWHEAWNDEPAVLASPDASTIAQLTAALDLITAAAPAYRGWISCLLKEITPTRRPGEHTIASSSSAIRPGGIDIAIPAAPCEIAEMLVHECSHQYLHMAARIGALVTADARPHYSPLKRRDRPLDRILLGYHAFGNALLLYDGLRRHGLGAELDSRLATVTAYLAELIKPLASEAGLSPLGLEIFRPLQARLGDRHLQG